MRIIGFQPRRYFGYSIPSHATLQTLHAFIDSESEVVEIGCGLGLYGFVFGNSRFCKRWVSTEHPDTYKEWLPAGNQRPFAPVFVDKDPLKFFRPGTPAENKVLLTVWPEPESTYFLDEYVQYFDGETVIIIGTPGNKQMWDTLSHCCFRCTATTVCRIDMGFAFDYESIFVWQRKGKGTKVFDTSRRVPLGYRVSPRLAVLALRCPHTRIGAARTLFACRESGGPQARRIEARSAHDAGAGRVCPCHCGVCPCHAEGADGSRGSALHAGKGAPDARRAGTARIGTKG